MFCVNCSENLKKSNNQQSHFMSYSLVPDKIKFFESVLDQTKSGNKELPKEEVDSKETTARR